MAQNLKNHSRFVPPFHFLLSLLMVVYLGLAIWSLVRTPGLDSGMRLLLAVILLLVFFYMRAFPLAVQDRLIRLEMRLRLAGAVPADLEGRISELTVNQLIGLRFAGDAELPGLMRRVLDGELVGRQQIKAAVTDWQADDCRC